MEGAEQGESPGGWWKRAGAWLREREPEPPPLGATVGGFQLKEELGRGGYGTVYLAHRGGRRFAVKFIPLKRAGGWGHRELEVMLRLREVGAVELEGHGKWPDDRPRFLYIAMEYVEGLTLDTWAEVHNPTARQVAGVALALARRLVAMHGVGVVHRDLKGSNVVVRSADGQPVLLDHGVSTYEGAPHVTKGELPGTRYYRSPEALRSLYLGDPSGRRPPSPGDDLWAHGVLLYWLLTGTYPFDHPDNWHLASAILHQAPRPPHERNPRGPRALGELCLRQLEKKPEDRYADAAALVEALEAVLAGADASWDVPLCLEWSPDTATTGEPRRGRPLPPEEPPTPARPTVTAPPRPSARARSSIRLTLALGALALAAVALFLVHRPTSPVSPDFSTSKVSFFGREVAPPWKPPDGDEDAAPVWALTPAPVASATIEEDNMRVNTPPTASTPRKNQTDGNPVSGAMKKAAGAAAALMLSACSGAQVRPTPPPEDCPPGAVENMKRMGIFFGEPMYAIFPVRPGLITVHDGQHASVEMFKEYDGVVAGTFFMGRLIFGNERVYGRFTEAKTPDGRTFAVCLEALNLEGDRKRGLLPVDFKAGDNTARVTTALAVQAVRRFE